MVGAKNISSTWEKGVRVPGRGVRVPGRVDISTTWEVWGREQGKGMVRKRWIIAWGWGREGRLLISDRVGAGVRILVRAMGWM